MENRFCPVLGETYWHIDADGSVESDRWEDLEFDNNCWVIGNCFRTQREALDASKKIREVLTEGKRW